MGANWRKLHGQHHGNGTSALRAVGGATTAQSFYLDEVVITETAPPPGGTPIATYTFADGGLDGWAPFGSASLANTYSADAGSEWRCAEPSGCEPHGGLHGAEPEPTERERRCCRRDVSGDCATCCSRRRTAAIRQRQFPRKRRTAPTHRVLTVILRPRARSPARRGLRSRAPSASAICLVRRTSLVLYIQSSSATDSFYIDDVTIGELSPPPPSLSQQDKAGSPRPSRMAAWTGGVRVRVPR